MKPAVSPASESGRAPDPSRPLLSKADIQPDSDLGEVPLARCVCSCVPERKSLEHVETCGFWPEQTKISHLQSAHDKIRALRGSGLWQHHDLIAEGRIRRVLRRREASHSPF